VEDGGVKAQAGDREIQIVFNPERDIIRDQLEYYLARKERRGSY